MNFVAGVVIVLASVAGGFVLNHGQLAALWQPFELLIVGGAALGAFVIANPLNVITAAARGVPALLKPSPYNKERHLQVLALLYDMFQKIRQDGVMAIENDIESPESSALFQKHSEITADHHALNFIIDNFRLILSGNFDALQLDNLMTLELETHHEEAEQSAHAVNRVADSLPGFGIVAAVLGIVITMASLGGETNEIGKHVAAALVGTFLGILLAYGFVAPISQALESRAQEQNKFLGCVKTALLATLQGYSPQIAVEFGRKVIFSASRPTFEELEQHVRGRRT
jgi:chemotaxis protein MotA